MHDRAGRVPAVTRSHVVLALVAGVAGLLAGRAMPHAPAPTANTTPTAPPTAPAQCRPERAQLASTRAQLAICMAYRAPSTDAEPVSSASPEPPAHPIPAHESLAQGMARLASDPDARKFGDRLVSYPEAVLVRKADGTQGIYRPDEHSADSDDVYARKLPDGHIIYYLGPDAGPRSDPDAWGSLRDLADLSPDGQTVVSGTTRLVFPRRDAGSP
jgi:hypothetical protein